MLENVVFVSSAKQPQSPDLVRMHRLAVLVHSARHKGPVCLEAQFFMVFCEQVITVMLMSNIVWESK